MQRTWRSRLLLLVATGCLFVVATPLARQDEALDLQARAIARIDAFIDHFRRSGDFNSRLPELLRAGDELAASNRILESRGQWSALALGLIKRGHVYRMQGQWQEAIALYDQAERAAVRGTDVLRQADALAWRALVESSSRNYGPALANATRAVRLAEKTSDRDLLARALDVLGGVQLAQLDLSAAAETLSREVTVAAEAKEPLTPFYAYLSRSDVHLKRAERCDFENAFPPCYEALDRARADLQQALAIARPLGYSGLVQLAEGFVQNVETRRELIRMRERSLGVVEKARIFNPRTIDDVLVTERFVAPAQQAPAGFNELIEASRRERKAIGGFAATTEARHLFIEGLAQEMFGNQDAALEEYLKAVDALEADRRTLRDERSRGTFLEDRINFYYAAVQQLLERRRHEQAFQILERSRSRALADLLASRNPGLGSATEQKLFSQLMVLRTEIATAQASIFELVSGPDTASSRKQVAELQGRIRSLDADYEQLAGRIGRESPRLQELVTSEPASLPAVQRALAEDGSELLQYLVLEHAVLLWHVTPRSVRVRSVFLPRPEVMRKTAALRASLADRHRRFDETTAGELFLYLIAPALSDIRTDRLVIVPHEDLNYIPFQVLMDPSTRKFAGERFQVTYAPSASVYLALKRAPGLAGGRLLAVADPDLDAAGEEVAAIAKHFPGRHKVVTAALPSESDVKTWIAQFDVIHLAVHGQFDANEPLLSSLKFAKSPSDDGRLTAAEMFGLPLTNSRLVVLSACETGRAQATHANEVIGMLRALMYAGAGTLILSHWEVDSIATARWMETFYDAARSQHVAEAARAALLKVKSTPEYAHPYYWAAFSVVGR